MKKEWFIWLRENRMWLFLTAYFLVHLIYLEYHPFILFKVGFAVCITVLATWPAIRQAGRYAGLAATLLTGIAVFFLDEILIPDLADHSRMRYLLPLTVIAVSLLIRRFGMARVWRYFLGLTLLFLCSYLTFSGREEYPFRSESRPANAVFDSLEARIGADRPVTLILADGYPSKRILSEKFGVRMRLDSLLKDYRYTEFRSRYISTPISVSNILFGAVFEREDENFSLRGKQSEVELVKGAMARSSLNDSLEGKQPVWASFVMEKRYNELLDLPWWKRDRFRAMFGDLYKQYLTDKSAYDERIDRYNRIVLSEYTDAMHGGRGGRDIFFLHLLTFHSSIKPMQREVSYADSLILEAVRRTPPDRSVILFSDHGSRDSSLDPESMRSGILMTGGVR